MEFEVRKGCNDPVCSLARLQETVEEIGASHVVTLLRDTDLIVRPPGIAPDNHLIIHVDDITCPIDGYPRRARSTSAH